MQWVRPNGQITNKDGAHNPGIFTGSYCAENVTLQGSFSHNWPVWERVLALLAGGQLDVKPIIGGGPVNEWQEAFEMMHKGEVVKSVLKPV